MLCKVGAASAPTEEAAALGPWPISRDLSAKRDLASGVTGGALTSGAAWACAPTGATLAGSAVALSIRGNELGTI